MDRDDTKLEQPLAAGHDPHPGHRRHAPPLYGVMAEFENPTDLVAAARKVYSLGYRRINGYSPYPIEELSEAIGFTHTSLPLIVFIGGVVGGLAGFFFGACSSGGYLPAGRQGAIALLVELDWQ